MDDSKMSDQDKFELMADKLMIRELGHDEVVDIIKEYFGDYKSKNMEAVTLGGMEFSFKSDKPLITAAMYYKNISKVYKMHKLHFNEYLINVFKNMIMGNGNTNIKVETPEDYRNMQVEFRKNFNENPMSSKVFNSISNDKDLIERMVNNPQYYLRVKSIFTPVNPYGVKKLESVLLEKLDDRLNELESERLKREDKEEIDLEIHNIKKTIELIKK